MTFEEVDTAIRLQAKLDAEGGGGDILASVEEFVRLRAVIARLEEIYNTDRVAHDTAREIETIFDEHLHSSPGSEKP